MRRAFRALGHEAFSCDTERSADDSPHHIQGDVLKVLDDGWDLGIFFPPCTYLCSSGMHWTTRGLRDPKLTEDALDFVLALFAAPIPCIALENPRGAIGSRIRSATQSIQPYQFGDDASKETFLWLKNLPQLQPTKFVPPRLVCGDCKAVFAYGLHKCPACHSQNYKPRWSNQTDSGQNKLGPSATRARDRARTYPGIAQAMARQWSVILPSK